MKTPQEQHFWNPYLAGIALGLVLLTSFVVMGWGLGSSGAANRMAVLAAHTVAPEAVELAPYLGNYVTGEYFILDDWLVFEVLVVFLGGIVAAYSAGRMKWNVLSGAGVTPRTRLLMVFAGGTLMGVTARLARGCTSGQALSGGAVLSTGSWIFMLAVFADGYAIAPLVRRQWR